MVGESDQRAYVSEVRFKRIRRASDRSARCRPVLCIADSRHVTFSVLANARTANLFRAIRSSVAPGAAVVCADDALYGKLSAYRQRWHAVLRTGPDPTPAAMRSDISVINAKWVIRKLYGHVGEDNLWAYLNEQAFRANAPRGRALFWTCMDRFPELERRTAGRVR